MTSRHLVDPELAPALDHLPKAAFTREALVDARAWLAGLQAKRPAEPPHPAIICGEAFAAGLNGAPAVRLVTYTHRTKGSGRPAYLHIHGGSFVMGSADMAPGRAYELAATLGCVIVSVDYRLAPETAFPGNVEDCYAALAWLRDHATDLGADPDRIAIGGESAGGGLAAALALYNRDKGDVPVIHQQLVYAMIDDRLPAELHPFTGEFGFTPARNRFGWSCLLGHEPGGDGVSPYAAAARAERLEGLPPAFIGVGALDLFMESNIDYARRLTRAGVPVELHIYPGAFHGSDIMSDARVSRQHARDQLEALRAAFQRTAH